jgi:hypothetical protein
MPRRDRSQALTTWEKRYVVRLVKIGGLDLAIEATRELKSASGIDACIE